jgi:hypothetical protein
MAWPAKVPMTMSASAGPIARRIKPIFFLPPVMSFKNQKQVVKAST